MKLSAWWSGRVARPPLLGLLFGQSPPYQTDFPPEEFRARWGPGSSTGWTKARYPPIIQGATQAERLSCFPSPVQRVFI